MFPGATCVVVAFHRPALLEGLLEMLVDPGVEVIVVIVEDDPAIGSLSGARILPVTANIGYAAGINLGAAHATADAVVFMNDDVSLDASGVLMMVARLRSGHADAVVPLVEDQDGELELARKIPYGLAKRMQLKGEPVPRDPTPIDSAWAPIVGVHTTLLRAVPMPEDYFLYGEETEWFHRLRQRGARIELLPTVRAVHYGGVPVVRPDKSRLMARNSVRMVRRIRGRGAALLVWPRVVAWQSRLLLMSLVLGKGQDVMRAHAAGVRAAVGAWREI